MQRVGSPPKRARRPSLSTGEAAAVASCHPTTILRAIQRVRGIGERRWSAGGVGFTAPGPRA